MPSNENCDPLKISCDELEDILRKAGRLRPECKLAEGDPTLRKRGEKVYVFDLIRGSGSAESAAKKNKKNKK
jgi:hypothetical protein